MKHMTYKEWKEAYNIEPQFKDCTECDGDGENTCPACENSEECEECNGTGEVDITELAFKEILRREQTLIDLNTRGTEEIEP